MFNRRDFWQAVTTSAVMDSYITMWKQGGFHSLEECLMSMAADLQRRLDTTMAKLVNYDVKDGATLVVPQDVTINSITVREGGTVTQEVSRAPSYFDAPIGSVEPMETPVNCKCGLDVTEASEAVLGGRVLLYGEDKLVYAAFKNHVTTRCLANTLVKIARGRQKTIHYCSVAVLPEDGEQKVMEMLSVAMNEPCDHGNIKLEVKLDAERFTDRRLFSRATLGNGVENIDEIDRGRLILDHKRGGRYVFEPKGDDGTFIPCTIIDMSQPWSENTLTAFRKEMKSLMQPFADKHQKTIYCEMNIGWMWVKPNEAGSDYEGRSNLEPVPEHLVPNPLANANKWG